MNAARERKRLAAHEGEPIGTDWRGRMETTITIHDRITGRMQTFDIYRGQRRDRYDIRRDGQPWQHGVTATWFSAALRKQITIELPPRAVERLDALADALECSKVAVIQRALAVLSLAIEGRMTTKDGREIVVL